MEIIKVKITMHQLGAVITVTTPFYEIAATAERDKPLHQHVADLVERMINEYPQRAAESLEIPSD